MSSSQSKDCDLSCCVQLVDAVLFCPNVLVECAMIMFSANKHGKVLQIAPSVHVIVYSIFNFSRSSPLSVCI